MGGFILRRLAISVPLVIVSSFVVFMLVAAAGDPLAELRGNPNVSRSTIEARRQQLHLDKPVLVRYGMWAKGAARGDFGRSFVTGEKVGPKLWRAIGVTMRLLAGTVLLALVFGVAIGVAAALRQYSKFDYLATLFAFVFFSMPVFWLAAVLKDVGIRVNQALGFNLFFTVGEQTPGLSGGFLSVWSDRVGHLILPALTLVLIQIASWSRYQRASMLEVLNADYVRTARAKGLPERRVVGVHALRNSLIPVVTYLGVDLGSLMAGAIVTEGIFNLPGIGQATFTAVHTQEYATVVGIVTALVLIFILANLLVDVLYAVLDPRIRYR
jgi:peptide/nickel transport system permease protein